MRHFIVASLLLFTSAAYAQRFTVVSVRRIQGADTAWHSSKKIIVIANKAIYIGQDKYAITQTDPTQDGSTQHIKYSCTDAKGQQCVLDLTDYAERQKEGFTSLLFIEYASAKTAYELVKSEL